MSNHLSSTFILVVSVLVLSSCGDRDSESGIRGFDDPSIPIMLNEDGPLFGGPLYAVQEDLVLGIDDGKPEWQIFGTSLLLMVGEAGRMYIADQPTGTIHIVDHSGELLGQFGARGSGPGEYQLIVGLWWIDDGPEVWLGDARLRRVTRYTPEGDLLDTIPFGTRGKVFGNMRHISNDRFIGITSERVSDTSIIHYGFLDENLEWSRDFVSLPGQRFFEAFPGSRAPLPFQTLHSVVSLPSGNLVIADPNVGRLTICSGNGEPLFHITRDWEFPRISVAEKQATLDRMRANIALDRLKNLNLPEKHAAFDYVLTDSQNQIWVRRNRMNQTREENPYYVFDVFDSSGAWVGTQSLDFNPNIITSEYAYDRRQSELHGPKVIRYKLTKLNRR